MIDGDRVTKEATGQALKEVRNAKGYVCCINIYSSQNSLLSSVVKHINSDINTEDIDNSSIHGARDTDFEMINDRSQYLRGDVHDNVGFEVLFSFTVFFSHVCRCLYPFTLSSIYKLDTKRTTQSGLSM